MICLKGAAFRNGPNSGRTDCSAYCPQRVRLPSRHDNWHLYIPGLASCQDLPPARLHGLWVEGLDRESQL